MPHIMPIRGAIETRGGERMALARTRYIAWKYYRRFFPRDFLPFPSPFASSGYLLCPPHLPLRLRRSKGDRPVHGNAMASEKRYGSALVRWKMHLERKIVGRLRGCWVRGREWKRLFTFGVFCRENVNRESKTKKDAEWRYRNIVGAICQISKGVRYKRVNMSDVRAACSWTAEIIAYCSHIRRKPHHASHASSASQMSSLGELAVVFILFFFFLASFTENQTPIIHFKIFLNILLALIEYYDDSSSFSRNHKKKEEERKKQQGRIIFLNFFERSIRVIDT